MLQDCHVKSVVPILIFCGYDFTMGFSLFQDHIPVLKFNPELACKMVTLTIW